MKEFCPQFKEDPLDALTKKESYESCPGTPEDGDCFSKPATVIRFPVERSRWGQESCSQRQQQAQQQQQQEGPLNCKWEGCVEDGLESEEKLLDHIKVRKISKKVCCTISLLGFS